MDRDVDALDALEFNNHFLDGSIQADLTQDRQLDANDFREFQRQYTGPR